VGTEGESSLGATLSQADCRDYGSGWGDFNIGLRSACPFEGATSGLSTELVWRERTVAAAMTRGVYVFRPCIVVGKA
jgi:hypothetical protein